VVVIGAGVVGAAAARALARRLVSVVLLERSSREAAQGSSRGTARIVAPFAYPDRSYLRLGLRAMERWRSLESSRKRFLDLRGALLVGSVVESLATSLREAGGRLQLLSTRAVSDRFGITGLSPEPVLYQPEAGVIRADLARHALLSSGSEVGVQMRPGESVLSLNASDEIAEVVTTRGCWRCRRAVVTAGPWTRGILDQIGLDLPLTVSSQTVAYYRPPPDLGRIPAVIEFEGEQPYALPDPVRGLKVALHRRGPKADPSGSWEVTDTTVLDRMDIWARSRFPGLAEPPSHIEACLYTNTPDGQFILEREGPIVIGSACNGQGFVVAPETGEELARLALEE
jgi:sarcosine oxidase